MRKLSETVTRAQGEPATGVWSSVEHTVSDLISVDGTIKTANDGPGAVGSYKDVNAACTRWLLAHGCYDEDFRF